MAIYHLEAKMVSRGAGRSAVAASAYLSCSRMLNEYDGVQHDYTRKQGLVWQAVFLPDMAPVEWQDREKLWNAVEETEKTKDSRLAREFVAALPIELPQSPCPHPADGTPVDGDGRVAVQDRERVSLCEGRRGTGLHRR